MYISIVCYYLCCKVFITMWINIISTGVSLSHHNRSPPKLVPRTNFGKKLPKAVPRTDFGSQKWSPLAKNNPPRGTKFGKHMLAKIGPPSKTESLYPEHACTLIMYTRLSSSRPTEALTRQSQLISIAKICMSPSKTAAGEFISRELTVVIESGS